VDYRLFLLVAALTTPGLFGQQTSDSITIGGDRFRLGMPRDQVLTRLASSFDVSGTGGRTSLCESSCWVWERGGPPSRVVANVVFKNGRLSIVTKSWEPDDQQTFVPFARSVYSVIAAFVKDGKTECAIKADQNEGPGFENRSAFIICGDRKVEVSVLRDDKLGEIATITEWLNK
jgi:hypothetical protein